MDEPNNHLPPLDQKAIDNIILLAEIMCTEEQIAAFLKVPKEVIQTYYMEHVERGWERGRIFLRQMQFNKARNGDQDMLEFLGKQYLGQF